MSKPARLHHFLKFDAIVATRVSHLCSSELTMIFFYVTRSGSFFLCRSTSVFYRLLPTSFHFCQNLTIVALIDLVFFLIYFGVPDRWRRCSCLPTVEVRSHAARTERLVPWFGRFEIRIPGRLALMLFGCTCWLLCVCCGCCCGCCCCCRFQVVPSTFTYAFRASSRTMNIFQNESIYATQSGLAWLALGDALRHLQGNV